MRSTLLFGVLLVATCMHGAPAPVPLPPTPPRPGAEAGPTTVGYAIWLGDVRQIDGVAQTFSVSFVAAMRWRDPQLAHAGPGAKQYSLDDIWHPRLLILNEAGDTERSLPEVADVAPDGTAVYRQRLIGTFSQSLNLRAFPFDRDTFRVPFVSLGHRPGEVVFVPDEMAIAAGMRAGIGLPEKLTIQDWRVESATTRVSPLQVTPGVELASFAFEFTAARRAQHFIIKVILPLILIVAMSWAVFWIEPTDASTQFGISITAMLTLIAYRFAIDGDVPKLPYLTKLDAFVLMSTVLVFLSMIEVMVTTKFANRDRLDPARKIDRRCRWIFPLVFVSAAAAIFLRGAWRKLGAVLTGFAVVLAWWLTLKPTNEADWQPDVAQTAWAEIAGDSVTLHNVRNCEYRTETDYTPRWETRTVRLSRITGIDMAINYWGSPWMAHPIVSFQFADAPPVCFSIETRKKAGQTYSAIGGLYRQFALTYIVADERDVIRVRTNYRHGEDVYLYRTAASAEKSRERFLEYAHSLNRMRDQPRWYNAVTTNCTTSIRAQHPAAKRLPWDWRMLVNGKGDEMLYERGAIAAGGLPFAELKQRAFINPAAQAANDAPDFSQRIRDGRLEF